MPSGGGGPAAEDVATVAGPAAAVPPDPAEKGHDPIVERHRDLLEWVLVLALIVRGLLSAADAIAIAQGGVRLIPLGQAVAIGSPSPFWPTLLAILSFAGAIGLAARQPIGWLLGVATCLAFVISGIGDLGMVELGAVADSPGFWFFFVADLVVPLVCLALLVALHRTYLPGAMRALPARAGAHLPRRQGPPL
jgi:hypothetical protein